MLQFSEQEQPPHFANEIRVEEGADLGVGHSTILDMNESIPQDDENSHTIDMRFSAFPESSQCRSVRGMSEDMGSGPQSADRVRNDSPQTKEFRFAVDNLRSQLHDIHFEFDN